jgi:DNA-binding NtrC family response regulator
MAAVLGFAGYVVTPCLTYKDALAHLSAHTADVLVTDLRLEDGNGWDLVKFVREQQPHIGVVVVSGYYDALAEENARRFGVAVLTKPFDPEDLVTVVKGMAADT